MKNLMIFIFITLFTTFAFAEKIIIKTGEALAISLTDYFFPMDISVTGSKCSVTGIKKIDKDLWCISILACKTENGVTPVLYEYYVKKGDIINLRRVNNPMKECSLMVEFITWNEALLAVQ